MPFIPMLQFQGNCAEAMTRYAEIFEADDLSILRYFEAPPEAGFPQSDLVVSVELRVGDALLRGMDYPPGIAGEPQASVVVNWEIDDAAEGLRLFDVLVDGGWPIIPYGPAHFAKGFGFLRDKFGTHWMLRCGVHSDFGTA